MVIINTIIEKISCKKKTYKSQYQLLQSFRLYQNEYEWIFPKRHTFESRYKQRKIIVSNIKR